MAIQVAVWKVGNPPVPLAESSLATERLLGDMIVASPQLLDENWMLIGREENTGYSGRIDLLAIDPRDYSLVLIELKRDRTPRNVIAQALDYAGWVEELRPEDINAIYTRFKPGRSLSDDFQQRYGTPLVEDSLNQTHQIVVVAATIDASTERIVSYLADHGIAINVLCFQIFTTGNDQLVSRVMLRDPVEVQVAAAGGVAGPKQSWNGEAYCNYGAGDERSWDDAVRYGFISAGGGAVYTKLLQILKPGDRVWVKAPGHGFVGVARVMGPPQPGSTFTVATPTGNKPVLEVAIDGDYHKSHSPEKCEHFVPVRWLQTVPLDQGVHEVGMFGVPTCVCKPTSPKWQSTVEQLKLRFPDYDK